MAFTRSPCATTVYSPACVIWTVPMSARLQPLPVLSDAPMPWKPGPLDVERLSGRGRDGHAEGGWDVEVDGVAAAGRLVRLLVTQLQLAGRKHDGRLARDREGRVVIGRPSGTEDEEEDDGVDRQERDDDGDDKPGRHGTSLCAGVGARWRSFEGAASPDARVGRNP